MANLVLDNPEALKACPAPPAIPRPLANVAFVAKEFKHCADPSTFVSEPLKKRVRLHGSVLLSSCAVFIAVGVVAATGMAQVWIAVLFWIIHLTVSFTHSTREYLSAVLQTFSCWNYVR